MWENVKIAFIVIIIMVIVSIVVRIIKDSRKNKIKYEKVEPSSHIVTTKKPSRRKLFTFGEAGRGKVWPQHIVLAFETWLECDIEDRSTEYLLQRLADALECETYEAAEFMMEHDEEYNEYVKRIHPQHYYGTQTRKP